MAQIWRGFISLPDCRVFQNPAIPKLQGSYGMTSWVRTAKILVAGAP
jgi:hypothetical protein